jgi:hypothetical protein
MAILNRDAYESVAIWTFIVPDRVFPEAGVAVPESGFQGLAGDAPSRAVPWNINKNKEIVIEKQYSGLVTGVHDVQTWAHSDRRSLRAFEREGRGSLEGLCCSSPPASEREARMDDPTPRSKKDRETECVFGALVLKREPSLFSVASKFVTRLPQALRGQALESALV